MHLAKANAYFGFNLIGIQKKFQCPLKLSVIYIAVSMAVQIIRCKSPNVLFVDILGPLPPGKSEKCRHYITICPFRLLRVTTGPQTLPEVSNPFLLFGIEYAMIISG